MRVRRLAVEVPLSHTTLAAAPLCVLSTQRNKFEIICRTGFLKIRTFLGFSGVGLDSQSLMQYFPRISMIFRG